MNRPLQALIARRGFKVGVLIPGGVALKKTTECEHKLGDKEIRASLRMLTQDSFDVRL
jgi:hypothetical protein